MRAVLCLATGMLCCASLADEKPDTEKPDTEKPDTMVNVGDLVPDFQAVDDQGKVWKSTDYVGKKILVVYFYPADLTGGCTRQACAFRDQRDELGRAGIEVVGVSGDSAENHQLFKKLHSLNFALLADEDGKVAKSFGVPLRDGASITKQIDGVDKVLTRGVTAARWTFVIGLDGKVIHKNTNVDAVGDSASVLEVVKQHRSAVQS